MNVSIAEQARYLLEAAWRRRFLILAPIAVFFVVSALVAAYWPRMYASSLLLMLQERGSASPLRANTDIFRELRITGDEIETLLKSDRVLASAVLDLRHEQGIPTGAELQKEVRRLRSALFVKVVGNEFIEIQLRDSVATGLGAKLANISTRFLETFLAREDSLKTARHFALEQRSRDLKEAKAALDAWRSRQNSPDSVSAIAVLDGASDREISAEVRLVAARKALEEAAKVLPGQPTDPDTIAQIVGAEGAESEKAQSGTDALRPDPLRRPAIGGLKQFVAAHRAAKAELSQAQAEARKARDANPAADALRQERLQLEARVADATALYETHQRRVDQTLGRSIGPLGLAAPERMRIIDEPRDPLSPMTSIFIIYVACIGAGVAIGICLAALAEQIDGRIYSSSGFARLTGLPLITSLPKLHRVEPPAEAHAAPISIRTFGRAVPGAAE